MPATKQGLGIAKIAQSHEGGRVCRDDAAAFHADKGDEGPDAHHDGELEIHRHGIDDELADARDGEQQNDARYEHGPEARLPGIARRATDVVGEKGRDTQPRSDAHGKLGPKAHDKGRENGHPYGGRHGGVPGHASVGQHAGHHKDEVAHGHEAGETGQHFPFDRTASRGGIEQFFQHTHGVSSLLCDARQGSGM